MDKKTKRTIRQFKKLKLESFPYTDVVNLFSQLGSFGVMSIVLHPGKTIMRARPNDIGQRFFQASEYSYKPQQFNKTYQRASTPNNTMFYGCIQTELEEKEGTGVNPRIVGALESLDWLRSPRTKCFHKISYGRWGVTRDIHLAAILPSKKFLKRTKYTNEIVDEFERFKKDFPEMVDDALVISDFLAKQYKRYDANKNHSYKYLISAIFSELASTKGLDGVVYPSVRVLGKGLNVAIKPNIVNSNLELLVAGECSIYKNKKKTMVDNETVIQLQNNQSTFTLPPVSPQYHHGEQNCLKAVGVKSIDELKNDCVDYEETIWDRILQYVYQKYSW